MLGWPAIGAQPTKPLRPATATRLVAVWAQRDELARGDAWRVLCLSDPDVAAWGAAGAGSLNGQLASQANAIEACVAWLDQHSLERFAQALGQNESLLLPASSGAKCGEAAQPGDGDWFPAVVGSLARLARLEREFSAALEQEKLAGLVEFAAGAGHEINNPLAVISGRAQLLLAGETHPERRHDLAVIHAQAWRIHEMIADLMLFARPPAPQWARHDLALLLDAVALRSTSRAKARGATIARRPGPSPAWARVDGEQIQVLLGALVDNALEAVSDGGKVELSLAACDRGAAASEQGWALSVEDDGPGIDPAIRARLFDPFFSGRNAGRGVGLGLAKCWRIAEMHQGRLTVASGAQTGALFLLRLPAA